MIAEEPNRLSSLRNLISAVQQLPERFSTQMCCLPLSVDASIIGMAMSAKQKSAGHGAMVGLANIAVLFSLSWLVSVPLIEASSTEDRLSLLTACLTAPAVCLAAAIGRLANHRFKSTADIDSAVGGEPSPKARILAAILLNTCEQTLLASLVYTIAALQLPPSFSDAIAYAAISFLIGRILFGLGYEGGARRRAAGFALTFYPTVMLGLMTAASMIF